MIPTLNILVGLPGSGKSTFAKSFKNCKVFSSDSYRENLLGDINNQDNNDVVFKTLYADLKQHLKSGKDAVLDATNISYKSRSNIFNQLSGASFSADAYIMCTPLSKCIERDLNRDRTVGDSVVNRMAKNFQSPQHFEGFSNIYYVPCGDKDDNFYNASGFDNDIERAKVFDQQNAHHELTLGDHMDKVYNLLVEATDNRYLQIIGKVHDIGKLYTQSFTEDGQAHYYSHANISAYLIMCAAISKYCLTNNIYNLPIGSQSVTKGLFYVQEHMHIRDILKSEKAILKYKKLWGTHLFDDLVLFMEIDDRACFS